MTDYGVDPCWLSHEPWVVPEPFTPEAGEMWSKEDIDYWIAVVAAHLRRGLYRPRPRSHRAAPPADPPDQGRRLDDPARWAMTWRAYQRKHRR